jgi:hypothetical protein
MAGADLLCAYAHGAMAAIAATSASDKALGDRFVIMSFLDQVNWNRPHSARDITQDQFDDLISFVWQDLVAIAPPFARFKGWGAKFHGSRDY